MKLSELKIEDVLGMTMHENEQDYQRKVCDQKSLDSIRDKLMEKFGDVEIAINPDADWFNQVTITSENWIAAHKAFNDKKQEWCDRYGCE